MSTTDLDLIRGASGPADFGVDIPSKKTGGKTKLGDMRMGSPNDIRIGDVNIGQSLGDARAASIRLSSWSANDFDIDKPKTIKRKRTVSAFVDEYMARREKEYSQYSTKSSETEYYAAIANRFAVQNGPNVFSSLHLNISKGLERHRQFALMKRTSDILGIAPSKLKDAVALSRDREEQTGVMGGGIQVADILGIDALQLKKAMELAKREMDAEGVQQSFDDESKIGETNDLFGNRRRQYSELTSQNAFGTIDINVIFIRDWLEEKGTSWFGNRFSLFILLFTIVFVGGIMILMMSGVLGDLIKTGIPKYIEF